MSDKSNSPLVKELAKLSFPDYNGRKFYIDNQSKPMHLHSYWDGGSKDDYRVIDIATHVVSLPEMIYPYGGEKSPPYKPQVGMALVRRSVFCGKEMGCTVFFPITNDEVNND